MVAESVEWVVNKHKLWIQENNKYVKITHIHPYLIGTYNLGIGIVYISYHIHLQYFVDRFIHDTK